MLLSVNVLNPSNDELILELTNPEASGFTIRSIDGIGPTKSNISIYDIPSIDGGLFVNARTQSRNIVMKLGYMWITTGDHTTPLIEDARHLSYKYFPLKRKVKLEFVTDYRTLYIDGYVESNEPDIFSKDEVTQISIMCPDPNFYSSEIRNAFINYPNQNGLELPTSNENSIIGTALDHSRHIEFSRILGTDSITIDYDGDNTSGVQFELYFYQDFPKEQNIEISFINKIQSTKITLNPSRVVKTSGFNIIKGDRIIIDGRPGHKSVIFKRWDNSYNVFNAITLNELWPNLQPGENSVVLNAGQNTDGIRGCVIYRTLFDGV